MDRGFRRGDDRGPVRNTRRQTMRILYFAWLRTKIGRAEEMVQPPPEVATVAALVDWLAARGPQFAEALKDRAVVRIAVNQEYVGWDHELRPGDEVALFPPVTGG
jgi:molybdopterin synthase sulfur carrier subunit